MLILTLTENAIKHGIEPSVHPGMIRIRIGQTGQTIQIMTEDNGVGLSEIDSGGTGLQNTRDRLHLMLAMPQNWIFTNVLKAACARVSAFLTPLPEQSP
jgi:sensor histidine kinase YesM